MTGRLQGQRRGWSQPQHHMVRGSLFRRLSSHMEAKDLWREPRH